VGGRDPDVGYKGVLSEAPSTRDDQMLRPLLMSALRHKRTFARLLPMSPFPPKADIVERDRHVRYVPKADSCIAAKHCHSITSSASTRRLCGTSSPSALAVVRLTARSNLVGCSIGISPGLAPRRIWSTISAVRRNISGKFGP